MTATATVLPNGSVTVTDGDTTYPPLSPEAVAAVAAQAQASATAGKSRELAEALATLAKLITAAAPLAGDAAYAQVTVTPGQATAVVDPASFALLRDHLPGESDANGNWVAGPVTVSVQPTPTPAPTPTPDPGGSP